MSDSINSRWTPQELEIARLQFANVDMTTVNALLDDPTVNAPEKIVFESVDHNYALSHRELQSILTHGYTGEKSTKADNFDDIIHAYMGCIASYVNVNRIRTRQDKPSIAVLPETFLQRLRETDARDEEIQEELMKSGCKGQDLLSLDYLFIPYIRRGADHWVLFGVAPKQRLVFVIDSLFHDDPYWCEIKKLRDLIMYELNDTVPANWALITSSSNMSDPRWQGRIAVRQTSHKGCPIIIVTKMLCLSFGYPLLCYSNEKGHDDITPYKRRRVANELIHEGFVPPYFCYPLLPIPTAFTAFETQAQEPRTKGGWRATGWPLCVTFHERRDHGEDDQPGPDARVRPGPREGKRRRDDDDDDEEDGDEDREAQRPRLMNSVALGRRVGSVKAGKGKKKRTKIEPARADCDAQQDLEAPETQTGVSKPSNEPPYPLFKELGNLFPKQFPPKFFEARLFIEGNTLRLLDGSSKKNLMDFCRDNKPYFRGFYRQSRGD